ncbi:MAG: ATP-binding protein [bacterium]
MTFGWLTEHNAVLIGVLLFGIALWTYFSNRRRPRNVTLAALLAAGGYWSFAHILWRVAETPDQAAFWLQTMVFISSLLPMLFLLFVLTLFRGRMPSLSLQLFALLPNVAVFWLAYWSGMVVFVDRGVTVFGPGLLIVGLHFGVMFLLSLLALLLAARSRPSEHGPSGRTYITSFAGSVVAFNSVFAILVGAASPYDPRAFWAANLALAVGLLVMSLPAVGHRLLADLRLVGGELFVLTAVTLVIADLVVSESMLDFAFRLVLLNILVFYGVVTMRALSREVRRLHQVEKLTEQVTRMNRHLMAADRMKMRFLSFASHQLRAPLSGVFSYLSMLEDGTFGRVTKKQHEVLKANIEAVVRMRDTIETFLDVSKLEMGEMRLDLKDVRVDLLAGDVVREVLPKAEAKGIEVNLEVTRPVPAILADSGKLYHALLNIVDNAVKYTERGRVSVAVGPDDGCVVVSVTDTGRGLSDERLRAVRRLLTHGLEEIKFDQEGGSGLGIHIARRIVDGHGGKMDVMSLGEGRGSTFSIRLPKSGRC